VDDQSLNRSQVVSYREIIFNEGGWHVTNIDWYAFTWEAFVTILAGVLAFVAGGGAIIGTVAIGKRQAAILREQTDIQARLTNIEELKLRSELFEDRFKAYVAVRKWIQFHVSHASAPGDRGSASEPKEAQIREDYFSALDRARFLFSPSVYANLNRLHRSSMEVTLSGLKMAEPGEEANHHEHVRTKWEALRELHAAWDDLGSVFGDELNLSVHGSVHGNTTTGVVPD
jgi:hypothetical protein